MPQQKQKQAGNCSRIAPKIGAGSWAAAALDDHLAGEHDLAHLPRRDPLCRRLRPRLRTRPAAGRCGSRGWAVGCGSSSGSGRVAAGRRGAPRARPGARSASSPGPTIALTVRKVRSPLRQSESSGRTSEPGASEDQVEEPPPSGSKAKPPSQTGPAPAGSPRRLVDDRVAAAAQALGGDVAEAVAARARRPRARRRARRARTRGRAAPSRTSGRWPGARRRRPRRGRRSRPRAVTLTSASARALRPAASLEQRVERGERLSRDPGRSRSRRCGPFRPARGGGPSARRPRSCRPSR